MEDNGRWPIVRLGDLCDKIGSGATPRGGQSVYLATRKRFALVRSQNVFDRWFDADSLAFISDEDARRLSSVELQEGDVLLNITGDGVTFGRACLTNPSAFPCVVNQHVAILRPSERLDSGYLLAYLNLPSTKEYIESFNAGGSRRAITKGHIESFLIPLPPLPEQRGIATMLGTFDDKIAINRQINQTIERIAQSIFKSWFVDFDPVKAKIAAHKEGRDPIRAAMSAISGKAEPELDALSREQFEELAVTAALFPEEMEDSELGEVPSGWRVTLLDRFADLRTPSVSPGREPEEVFEHYSIPAFDEGLCPAYEPGSTIKSNKYKVSPTAVLVSKLNPVTPRIWLPSVKTSRAVSSTEFMQFVPKREHSRFYLYLLMKSDYVQSEILKRVDGSTGSRQRARPSQIAVLPVLLPAEPVLLAFDRLVAPLLDRVAFNLDESATLAALRDTLLPKLLSGELSVSRAEEAAV